MLEIDTSIVNVLVDTGTAVVQVVVHYDVSGSRTPSSQLVGMQNF